MHKWTDDDFGGYPLPKDCNGNEIHMTDTLVLALPDYCDEEYLNGRHVRIRDVVAPDSKNPTFLPKGLDPVTRKRFSKSYKIGIYIPFAWTKILD